MKKEKVEPYYSQNKSLGLNCSNKYETSSNGRESEILISPQIKNLRLKIRSIKQHFKEDKLDT